MEDLVAARDGQWPKNRTYGKAELRHMSRIRYGDSARSPDLQVNLLYPSSNQSQSAVDLVSRTGPVHQDKPNMARTTAVLSTSELTSPT